MKVSRRLVLLAAAAIALPLRVGATTLRHWYVDARVVRSGDGLSWATAWQSASDTTWAAIALGDTIFFSGGSSSVIYIDSLEISHSGEEDLPIVVTAATDPDHDGEVIFDFGDSGNRVRLRDCANVVVSGFTIRNGLSGSVAWLHSLRGGVVFRDHVIETGLGVDRGNARGIDIRQCSGEIGPNVVSGTVSARPSTRRRRPTASIQWTTTMMPSGSKATRSSSTTQTIMAIRIASNPTETVR